MPARSRTGESSPVPLGQRLGRLALEVEHHPAVRGAQHLAEVVVAVDPLHRHAGLVRAERPERRAQAAGVRRQLRHGRPARRPAAAASASARAASVGGARACRSAAPGPGRRAPRRWPRRAGTPRRRSRRRPRRRAGRPRRTGRGRWSWPAPSPSVAVRKNSCSMARSASAGCRPAGPVRLDVAEQPGHVPGAALELGQRPVHLDVRVAARASTRRNTLRIAASSKTSEVFDCSPVMTRLVASSGSSSGCGPGTKPSRPVRAGRSAIPVSQAPVTSLSCSASYHQDRPP